MAAKTRRLTLSDLKRAAGKFGGTVEGGVIGRYASYNVDAPDGKIWSANGLHHFNLTWYADGPGGSPTWPEEKQDAIADAIDRVGYGVEDCDEPECDICHPED